MKTLQILTLTLTIIGAINWGLIGIFDYDLVASIFGGAASMTSRVIYTIIGLSGIVCLRVLFNMFDRIDSK